MLKLVSLFVTTSGVGGYARHDHIIQDFFWNILSNFFMLTPYRVDTTGIRAFAECRWLYRVLFIGHSAKPALPSAALGNVLRSVKS
jgi:hypothetical protein